MRDAKGVPEHDICVVDAFVAMLGNPFGKALRGLTGCLGYMSAGGMDLVVLVWGRASVGNLKSESGQGLTFGNVNSVPCKPGTFPNQTSLLR